MSQVNVKVGAGGAWTRRRLVVLHLYIDQVSFLVHFGANRDLHCLLLGRRHLRIGMTITQTVIRWIDYLRLFFGLIFFHNFYF